MSTTTDDRGTKTVSSFGKPAAVDAKSIQKGGGEKTINADGTDKDHADISSSLVHKTATKALTRGSETPRPNRRLS